MGIDETLHAVEFNTPKYHLEAFTNYSETVKHLKLDAVSPYNKDFFNTECYEMARTNFDNFRADHIRGERGFYVSDFSRYLWYPQYGFLQSQHDSLTRPDMRLKLYGTD